MEGSRPAWISKRSCVDIHGGSSTSGWRGGIVIMAGILRGYDLVAMVSLAALRLHKGRDNA
jgi:hypothetical protein